MTTSCADEEGPFPDGVQTEHHPVGDGLLVETRPVERLDRFGGYVFSIYRDVCLERGDPVPAGAFGDLYTGRCFFRRRATALEAGRRVASRLPSAP